MGTSKNGFIHNGFIKLHSRHNKLKPINVKGYRVAVIKLHFIDNLLAI